MWVLQYLIWLKVIYSPICDSERIEACKRDCAIKIIGIQLYSSIILYCTFRKIGILSFYVFFFESRLIPTSFLILGWGYQPERVQAGIYLLFYTLLASLPLLVGILFIYNSLGSLCFLLLSGSGSFGWWFILCLYGFCPFWLGCLYLWFIYDFLALMFRLLFRFGLTANTLPKFYLM